jgi:hypothetical protein
MTKGSHDRQPNRRAERQRRAAERAAQTPTERAACAAANRRRYRELHPARDVQRVTL